MTINFTYFGTLLVLAALGPTGEATLFLEDHCGETISIHGDLLYSQYSINYDNNMDCLVTIQSPYDYQRITLDFAWIDLYSWNCDDFIEINDTDGSLIKKFCGDGEPPDIFSSGNIIYIYMVTDNSGNDKGFRLVFTAFHDGSVSPCNGTSQFLCSNDRCIDDSLTCNNNNNCNDASDEHNCSDDVNVSLVVFVVLTVIAVSLFIIVSVYSHYTRKKKQRNANSNTNGAPVNNVAQEDNTLQYGFQKDMTMYPFSPPAYNTVT